jgi:hypothetical protein
VAAQFLQLKNGGNIELVAGQSISFLEGTHLHEGAYLLGADFDQWRILR